MYKNNIIFKLLYYILAFKKIVVKWIKVLPMSHIIFAFLNFFVCFYYMLFVFGCASGTTISTKLEKTFPTSPKKKSMNNTTLHSVSGQFPQIRRARDLKFAHVDVVVPFNLHVHHQSSACSKISILSPLLKGN